MHTDAGGSGIRSAERQRAVQSPITTSVPAGASSGRGGLVEDQPVGGIDGEELRASRSGQRRRASGE